MGRECIRLSCRNAFDRGRRRLAQQRRRVSSAQHAARRANSSVCPDDIDSDSDDGADDSDSDGVGDVFAAEASDNARSPTESPGGSRSDSDNSNDGPGVFAAEASDDARSPPISPLLVFRCRSTVTCRKMLPVFSRLLLLLFELSFFCTRSRLARGPLKFVAFFEFYFFCRRCTRA